MLINKTNLDAIFFSWSTLYQKGYDAAPAIWDKIATESPSTGSETHYGWIGQLPGMRKWTGERQVKNLQARGYVLANEKYEDTIGVPRDKIEDDQIGVYNGYVEGMGQAAKAWPDQLVALAVEAGTTSLGFDGQFYFDGDHPRDMDNASSPTYRNRFDTSVAGGAVARPLNHENFRFIYTAMTDYRGDNNRPLNVRPKVLLVPSALEITAMQVVKEALIAPTPAFGAGASAGPQSNPFAGMDFEIVVNPYLTQSDAWYILDTRKPIKPFVFQLRNSPEFTFLNRTDDPNVFLHDEFLFGVRSRGAAGYTLPFLAARGSATT